MDYPYGEERWSSGTVPTDYRFTDQRREPELAIYHMGARWFDAYLSRWLSADSIVPDPSDPQSLNRYSWVLGNPLRYRDRSGQIEEDEVDDALEIREQLWALGVAILIDWYRMADGSWYRGLWTLEVLNWVRDAVLDMAGAMGGSDAFAEALPEGVIIERATASRYGTVPRGGETEPGGDWIRLFDAVAGDEGSLKSALVHELAHAWDLQNRGRQSTGLEDAVGGQTTFSHTPWVHRLLPFFGYQEEVYDAPGRSYNARVRTRREDWAYSVEAMVYGLDTSIGEFIDKGGTERYTYVAQALPGWKPQYHKPGR